MGRKRKHICYSSPIYRLIYTVCGVSFKFPNVINGLVNYLGRAFHLDIDTQPCQDVRAEIKDVGDFVPNRKT